MNDILHTPVLTFEILSLMSGKEQVVVDATCGNGGHSHAIMKQFKEGKIKLFCFDRDGESLEIATEKLKEYSVKFVCSSYVNIYDVLSESDLKADFILFDLGLSMWQIKASKRGFTYREDEILDMRFDDKKGVPLYERLKRFKPDELSGILKQYGDVKRHRKIAEILVKERKRIPLKRTLQLFSILRNIGLPDSEVQKIFMAFRIYINDELRELVNGIKSALMSLNIGGKVAFITYHSIEDRIVKKIQYIGSMERIQPYPVYPTQEEIKNNNSARSAKLRAFKKGDKNVKETDFSIFDSLVSAFPPSVYSE